VKEVAMRVGFGESPVSGVALRVFPMRLLASMVSDLASGTKLLVFLLSDLTRSLKVLIRFVAELAC
jgi:hypothetical protein